MLRAIELAGFKSFADRTRFEFPPGITVVVGPNGSGKSNVVDAIKWVLGEQSAKSLRGKEMADVIFNGSGSRRPLNSAEVTLTLDNAQQLLAVDTPQVQITRRVFRSGEGEYLINRQPSRLRDIRELFAGTGVATEAYSVIEQGKVDVLLQSSPRERRLIFEEAAGISRFKAKKVEAARRLERVEQNLLRLSDIVEEVESRLRSVRLQASKARRFREYTTRLEEVRTQLGLADWRRLSSLLAEIEAELSRLAEDSDGCHAETERIEAEALGVETEVARLDEVIRESESRLAAIREQIAAAESLIEAERTRGQDLEEEAARQRRQQSALSLRAGDFEQRVAQANQEFEAATAKAESLRRQAADEEEARGAAAAALDQLRTAGEARRAEWALLARDLGTVVEELATVAARREGAAAARQRASERLGQLEAALEQIRLELTDIRGRQEASQAEAEALTARLEEAQTHLAEHRRQLAEAKESAAELRMRRMAAGERAAVLRELEEKLEGIGTGVKQALADARTSAASPFRGVRGLVADLIEVEVEMAPLVDIALGDVAGHLVVGAEQALFDALVEGNCPLAGRVALVRFDLKPAGGWSRPVDYAGQAGVVGRADQFVRAADEYVWLIERLLGQTWIVEDLAVGRRLAHQAQKDARFVTLAGELVTADGSLHVGPRLAATGLVSRRAELRLLRGQIADLDRRIADAERNADELSGRVGEDEAEVKSLAALARDAQRTEAEQRACRQSIEQREGQLAEQVVALTVERDLAMAEERQASLHAAALGEQRGKLEADVTAKGSQLDADRAQLELLEAKRASLAAETTATKVELAKTEQQIEHLRGQLRQFELHREERQRAIGECETQLAACAAKTLESQRKILRVESELAASYLHKESVFREVRGQVEARERQRAIRGDLASRVQKLRARLRIIDDTSHERQLAAGEIRHERSVMADRLREDYGIELAELAAKRQPPPPAQITGTADESDATEAAESARENRAAEAPFDRAAAEQEIAELRRKIGAVGGVNLDALAELEELETRHGALAAQHNDLAAAKASLATIIERINSDSRRLFADTLETVRGHFQQLFRKLFGGGQADIVLEEGLDILDGGIEIVARPPGKEPRSISLLSGGEKTLTCVALLLAVFRSRPSPFCVLDEVDAALDEANIERFVGVLREFLAITQFIVVTHSKKTMTAASTLYGVTMQESGVSKRVSVRFEDVSETGEISQAAITRSASEDARGREDSLGQEVLGEPLAGEEEGESAADETQAA